MNKYLVCLLISLSLVSCDDNNDILKKEIKIKEGTTFIINKRQDSISYLPIDSFIIKNDTSLYGYEYKNSDLLYRILLELRIDTFFIGDFYIYNINDTIYIKEPFYPVYSNTIISKNKHITNIVFNNTDPIYNPSLQNSSFFENTSISIVGEIEIK